MNTRHGLSQLMTTSALAEARERLDKLRAERDAIESPLASIEGELPSVEHAAASARKLYRDAVNELCRAQVRTFTNPSDAAEQEYEEARAVKEALDLETQPRIVRANNLALLASRLRQNRAFLDNQIAQLEAKVAAAQQELDAEPDLVARIKARVGRIAARP